MATATKKTWLDFTHPIYQDQKSRWVFAMDHYLAEVADAGNITNYIARKAQGESVEAYTERCALADYTPHFSVVVDSLAGMLFAVEDNATRFFGDDESRGLGGPDDENSIMYTLWNDVDGDGTGWITFWKQLAIDLIVTHRAWVVVDLTDNGPQVKLWPATAVPNWRYDESGLAEVLVQEEMDLRASLMDDADPQKTYVHYTREGWTRWKKDERGNPIQIDADTFFFKDKQGNPTLPIFSIELPLRRNVGWILAKKCNAIFNRESDRDNLLRTANFPFLELVANDTQYKAITAALKKGARALQRDPGASAGHTFVSPDSGPATVASEVLKRKVEEFYIAGFREYGDAARERTATEVRQDVSSGVGAFLQMLKASVDDAENETLWRVAQIEYPTDESRWWNNYVDRSSDFLPIDAERVLDEMRKRYFGETVPVPTDEATRTQIAKHILEMDGFSPDDDALRSAVNFQAWKDSLDGIRELSIPSEAKAEMTIRLLVTLGLIDPEQEIEMEDGAKRALIDVIREKAEQGEEEKSQMQRLLTQPFGAAPEV